MHPFDGWALSAAFTEAHAVPGAQAPPRTVLPESSPAHARMFTVPIPARLSIG